MGLVLQALNLGGFVEDVGNVEEVDELGYQANIVHDEHFAVRSELGYILEVFDKDYALGHPDNRPKNQAANLDCNWHYVKLLLFRGRLHNLDELNDGASVQDDYGQDCDVDHVVAHSEQDLLIDKRQIIINRRKLLNQLADNQKNKYKPIEDQPLSLALV